DRADHALAHQADCPGRDGLRQRSRLLEGGAAQIQGQCTSPLGLSQEENSMFNRRQFLMTGTAAAAATVAMPAVLRAQSGPIRIGVITTLTGPGQLYGQYIKDGCELGAAAVNAAGGI